jgi:hypothetical protein
MAAQKTALMSPTFRFAYYALWFAHPVLQLGVAGVMFQRKVYRKFPVFFAYILSQVVIFAVVFSVEANAYEFFYAYWLTAAVSLALGFWVIYEIFLDIFQPYHTLKDLGAVLFQWAGLVMLLVAGVVAAASPISHEQDGPLVQAVLTSQRCVRVTQCGLVLFLLLFSRYLGVSRKQKSFGIALGFGFFAGVELFLVALIAARKMDQVQCGIVNMVAYNLSISVWLGYMWAKEKARDSSANLLMSQRWEQSFMDLQHPMPADSLIPMFENMVEEAISRGHESSSHKIPDTLENVAHLDTDPTLTEPTLLESLTATVPPPAGGDTSSERANSASASGSTSSKR